MVVKDLVLEEIQEYSDGSRREGGAAGANRTHAGYLGRYATAIDTELLGICMSWESGHDTAALDSQGAVSRATQLYHKPPKSWIEQRMQRCMLDRSKTGTLRGRR